MIRIAPKDRIPGSLAQMVLINYALAKRDGEAAACCAFVARSAEFAARNVERVLAEVEADGEGG